MPSSAFLKKNSYMKKKKITYGVSGMMEYQAIIKIGKATMKVPFSEGSMTAMGVNPARFTTENYMVQQAIEQSGEFRRGRIYKVSVIELDEEVKIEGKNNAGNNENHENHESDAVTQAEQVQGQQSLNEAKHFGCNDDARDYLEETFEVTRAKLRTRADILQYGQANGIEIIFDK